MDKHKGNTNFCFILVKLSFIYITHKNSKKNNKKKKASFEDLIF